MKNNKLIELFKDYVGPKYFKIFSKEFGRGYERYKKSLIIKKLNNKSLKPNNIFIDERIVEIPWVMQELKNSRGNLLDAGSTLNYEYLIKKINKKMNIYISTLYPEKNYYNNLGVNYIYEDLVDLSFKKNYFDVITCISTLEHVGFDNSIYKNNKKTQKRDKYKKNKHILVLKKLFEVLKPKGKLLLTIPYGKRGKYNNMQQFDKSSLKKLLNNLKTKKIFKKFYIFSDDGWHKVSEVKCKNIKPLTMNQNLKKRVLAANSVALIKILK